MDNDHLADIGLIGLAVMGENLVLNMESKGFSVAVFNRTTRVTEGFAQGRAKGKRIYPTITLEQLVSSVRRPRKLMIMVKAGSPVDAVIDGLVPLLEAGDMIIDGGNSLFTDTQRRCIDLEKQNILFLGTGVSGGEEGALKGPSLMPGGPLLAWENVAPIFRKIAAQVDGEPCCRYMGPDGAGHYVKMVHNGIEYGDMQLICEAYAILKEVLALTAPELHEVFTQWNKGELDSFLIDITRNIFAKIDEETGNPLVDMIQDKAGQKGTGKWTIISALELGVVVPTINAAVEARVTSSMKDQRVSAARVLSDRTAAKKFDGDRQALIDAVRDALYASKIISYAQGMDLLAAAGREHAWSLKFGDIATIWRGGCIIRARVLERIKKAYDQNPALPNLMLDPHFAGELRVNQPNWRLAVTTAISHGVAVPALSASLAYFDSFRQARLPANLLQAQRDYFGAHTYERVDRTGSFHTEWLQADRQVPESDRLKDGL